MASTRRRDGRRHAGSRFGISAELLGQPGAPPRSASSRALGSGSMIASLLGSGTGRGYCPAGRGQRRRRSHRDRQRRRRRRRDLLPSTGGEAPRCWSTVSPTTPSFGSPSSSGCVVRRWPSTCPVSVARRGPTQTASTTAPEDRAPSSGKALEALGVGEHALCVHDWGSIGLIAAQREPARVRRLCVINAVPLLPGYRWHRTARGWRTPVVGELSLRLFTKRTLALGLRESRGN